MEPWTLSLLRSAWAGTITPYSHNEGFHLSLYCPDKFICYSIWLACSLLKIGSKRVLDFTSIGMLCELEPHAVWSTTALYFSNAIFMNEIFSLMEAACSISWRISRPASLHCILENHTAQKCRSICIYRTLTSDTGEYSQLKETFYG